MTDEGMRAVIYTRISRDDEGEALGVKRQEQDCRARAERDGWTVVDVLVENDVSASSKSRKPRPEYRAMIDAAKRGDYDVIVAYSNSRLTRRPLEWEELIKLVEDHGVKIATVVSGDANLETADGRAVARTMAAWDAAEAERISERVRRKIRQRLEDGFDSTGGIRPYGYESDRLTVKRDEAAKIKDAAASILDGGSVLGIVTAWNRDGVPTVMRQDCQAGKHQDCQQSHEWTPQTLSAILRSPRIAGYVSHKGKIMGEAQWPAIVDHDTWERLHTRLGNGGTGNGDRQAHLLAGILRCSCGAPMGFGGQAGSYRCNRQAKRKDGSKGCGKVSRRADMIEKYVIDQWAEWMTKRTGSEIFTFSDNFDSAADDSRTQLEDEREEITRRIERTRTAYATGVITDEDTFPILETLRARLDTIDSELAKIDTPRPTYDGKPIMSVDIETDWRTALEIIGATGSVVDQREILARHIEKITVGPASKRGRAAFPGDEVEVTWRD